MARTKRRLTQPPKIRKPEPVDRVLLGLLVGCGVLILQLGRIVGAALYYLVWWDPKDARATAKGRRHAGKKV